MSPSDPVDSSSPASRETRSHLLSLPTELKLAIAKELGYFDLRRLRSVCKGIKELIEMPCFEGATFTGSPRTTQEESSQIILHPNLQLVQSWIIEHDMDAVLPVVKSGRKSFKRCMDLAACDENATSPSLAKICIKIPDLKGSELVEIIHEPYEFENRGVTVRQVIWRIIEGWSGPYKLSHPSWPESHFEMVSSKHSWKGWDRPRLNQNGVATLFPHDTYDGEAYPGFYIGGKDDSLEGDSESELY